MDLVDRFRGSIVGLAVGDALGHPTEFVGSVQAIRERWGSSGVTGFVAAGRHPAGTFTDDTQMAIAVARALVRAGRRGLDDLMGVMAGEFVAWSRSFENDRAPGGACLSGCASLGRGTPWRQAGVAGSKGCGAAMRAAPIGLYFWNDDARLAEVAAAQSAPTHRHPTAHASSVAAAAAVAFAVRARSLSGLLDFVLSSVERLDTPLLVALGCDPDLAEGTGVGEMTAALRRVRETLDTESDDVCRLHGGAWIGEEAVACALWCVLRAEGRFRETVLRGANSSGDSDSIACIAGSIAGALGGVGAIPSDWARDVEQAARLDALARALCAAAESRVDTPALGPDLTFFGRARRPVALDLFRDGPDEEAEEAVERDEDLDDDGNGTANADVPRETDDVENETSGDHEAASDPDTRALDDLDALSAAQLEERIRYHNQRYWDDDAPEISDVAYDRLARRLMAIAPDSEVLSAMGPTAKPTGAGVRHQRPSADAVAVSPVRQPPLAGARLHLAAQPRTVPAALVAERVRDQGGTVAETLDDAVTHVLVGDRTSAAAVAVRTGVRALSEKELVEMLGLGQLPLF